MAQLMGEAFPGRFAWDVYQRVEALDKLADEFPDHVRTAARRCTPGRCSCTGIRTMRRFQELANRLELGVDYPTDASEGARFRPDTPLVRYLEPLIYRLNITSLLTMTRTFSSNPSKKKSTSWI